jgi:hypothetical protein
MSKVESRRRRIVLSAAAAPLAATPMAGWLGAAQAADAPKERVALVIGNTDYPDGKGLPAAAKNVADVERALRAIGFQVETRMDVGAASFRSALESFNRSVAARPGSPIVLFYYCGHGVESEGDNLLLPAGLSESLPPSQIKIDGVNLQKEVLAQLPHVYPGLSITVIDACRTSLDGPNPLKSLNTDAPEGNIIMYATRAGHPALMPSDPNRNSFFTEVFVRALQRLNDANDPYTTTPVYSLLQHVRSEVFTAMSKHPLRLVRENAQDPHILHSIASDRFFLGPPNLDGAGPKPPAPKAESEAQLWRAVQSAVLPRDVQDRAKEYLAEFPNGPNAITAQVAVTQSERALAALAEPGMPLRPSGLSDVRGSERARAEAASAARGDKDAAQRIGGWYAAGAEGLEANPRRSEAWLRYASALGSGLASKRLVRLYQDQARVNDAAVYRRRAVELGQFLEPELSQERK